MKLEFIQELTEARMFRWEQSFKGMRLSKISEITYYMMLMLEIMRAEDPGFARTYAGRTIRYNKFQDIMSSATDIHNMYVVCTNPKEYADIINIDIHTEVPYSLVYRYMMDIQSNTRYLSRVRATFLALESGLKIRDSTARRLRREAVDWDRSDPSSKEFTIRAVYQYGRNNFVFADIYQQYIETVYRKIKYLYDR